MITAVRDIRGGLCFVGEGVFPHNPAVKYIYHPYSQRVTFTVFRGFTRKHFFSCCGFYSAEHCFQNYLCFNFVQQRITEHF